jgi:hypothetical protein
MNYWNRSPDCLMCYVCREQMFPHFLFIARSPLVNQGILIVDASWLHSDRPQSVGLIWTEWPVRSTFFYLKHKSLSTHGHPYSWRDSNKQSQQRAIADRRLRQRGNWKQQLYPKLCVEYCLETCTDNNK